MKKSDKLKKIANANLIVEQAFIKNKTVNENDGMDNVGNGLSRFSLPNDTEKATDELHTALMKVHSVSHDWHDFQSIVKMLLGQMMQDLGIK